ncbi:MAG: hypothetical protein ACXVCY_11315 [Pseudobdellovibrionaceae bacterium]
MKDYLHYLQDVLGIQNIMVASENGSDHPVQFFSSQGPFNTAAVPSYELIFLNIVTQAKESFFNKDVQDLFEKMKTAMKLKNIQVLELDCTVEDRSQLPSELAKICEGRVVVVFSSFPQSIGELIFKGSGKWIETYSPAYLLEDTTAKKVVWNDLQKVMKELGL